MWGAPATNVWLSTTAPEGAMAAAIAPGAVTAELGSMTGFSKARTWDRASMTLLEGAAMADAIPARRAVGSTEASPDRDFPPGGRFTGGLVGTEISSVTKDVVIRESISEVGTFATPV